VLPGIEYAGLDLVHQGFDRIAAIGRTDNRNARPDANSPVTVVDTQGGCREV
jgi:hypothetical protein